MTATNYGSVANKTAGTSFSIVTNAIIPVGRVLVLGMAHDNSASATLPTVSSITTVGGGSWTLRISGASGTSTTAGSGIFGRLYTMTVATEIAASTTITVTFSNSITSKAIVLWGFDGGYVDTLRGSAGSQGNTAGNPNATTSGPVSGDLVIGIIAGENNAVPTGDSDTTNGSWSTIDGVASSGAGAATNCAIGMQWKVVSATGSQTYNGVTSNDSVGLIVALIPDPNVSITATGIAAVAAAPAPTPSAGVTLAATTIVGFDAIPTPTVSASTNVAAVAGTVYDRGSTFTLSLGSSWFNTANAVDGAYGVPSGTYAAWQSTVPADFTAFDISGFDFSSVPSNAMGITLEVRVRHYEVGDRILALTVGAYDGGTLIDAVFASIVSTPTVQGGIVSLTYAQLSNLKIAFTVERDNDGAQGEFHLDYVDLSVSYALPFATAAIPLPVVCPLDAVPITGVAGVPLPDVSAEATIAASCVVAPGAAIPTPTGIPNYVTAYPVAATGPVLSSYTYDSDIAGVYNSPTGTGTLQWNDTDQKTGSGCLRFAYTGPGYTRVFASGTSNAGGASTTPVTPGQRLEAAVDIKGTNTGTVVLGVQFWRADGTTIISDLESSSKSVSSTYQRRTAGFTAPALAVYATPFVRFDYGSTPGTTHIDNLALITSPVQLPASLVVPTPATVVAKAGYIPLRNFDSSTQLATLQSAGTGTISRETTVVRTGAGSLKVTNVTNGAVGYIWLTGQQALDGGWFSVSPGSLKMRFWGRTGASTRAFTVWLRIGNIYTGANDYSLGTFTANSSTWTEFAATYTIPELVGGSPVHSATLWLAPQFSWLSTDILYFDDIEYSTGVVKLVGVGSDNPTPTTVGAVASVPDAHPKINAVKVAATAAILLPTEMPVTLSPSPINVGMASPIVDDYESGIGTATSNHGVLSQSTDFAVSGTYSLKLVPTASYSNLLNFRNDFTSAVDVVPGKLTTVSLWRRRDPATDSNASWNVWGHFYTSTGAFISSFTFVNYSVPSSGQWELVSGSTTAPATAARLRLMAQTATTLTSNAPYYFDQVSITSGPQGKIPQPIPMSGNAVLDAFTAIPLPTVTGGEPAPSPAVFTALSAVPTPTISTGVLADLTAVAAVAAVPTPVVSAGLLILPTAVAAVAAFPAATMSAGTTVDAVLVASLATVPTPTMSMGATVDAATVAPPNPAYVPAVTITNVISQNIAAPIITSLVGQPSPTEATGSTISASRVIAPGVAFPARTMSTGSTITAAVIPTYMALVDGVLGSNWTVTTGIAPTTRYPWDIDTDGTRYVMGDGQSGYIAISTKLSGPWTWYDGAYPIADIARSLTYGNGLWVLGSTGGYYATATDPAGTWTDRTALTGYGTTITGLGYGNGVWVATISSSRVATTADPAGGSWTANSFNFGASVRRIEYGGGVWVATTDNEIFTATDPTGTWTQRASAGSIGFNLVYGSNGTWAAGYDKVYMPSTPTDPTTAWAASSPRAFDSIDGLANDGDNWAAIGWKSGLSGLQVAYTGNNGATWRYTSTTDPGQLRAMRGGGGELLFAGGTGWHSILSSPLRPSTGSTVTATTVAAVGSVGAVTIDVGSDIAATLVAATASVSALTPNVGSTLAAAAVITPGASVLSTTESAGQTVAAVCIAAPGAAVPTAFPGAGVTIAAVTVAPPQVTVPLPTFQLGATPTPAAVAPPKVTVPLPTITYGQNIAAVTVAPPSIGVPITETSASILHNAVALASVAQVIRPAFHVAISTATVASTVIVPAVSLSNDATVVAVCVAPPAVTVPSVAVSTAVTLAPTTAAALVAVPAPTLGAGQTVSAAMVYSYAAQPSTVESAGSQINPANVVLLTDVPLPTFSTSSILTPATVATLVTVPSATASAGVEIAAALVAPVVEVLKPTIPVMAKTVALVVAIPTPTTSSGILHSAETVASIVTILKPDMALSPFLVTTAVGIPLPTVGAGLSIAAVTVAPLVTIPAPSAAASTAAAPAAVSPPSVTIPAPTTSAGVLHTATTVTGTSNVVRPGFDATVDPATVVAATTVPTPTTQQGVDIAAVTVPALVAVPGATVEAGGAGIGAVTVSSLVAVSAPSMSASITIAAPVVDALAGQPSPEEAAGSVISAAPVSPPMATVPEPTASAGSTPTPATVAQVVAVIRPAFDVDISAATVASLVTVPTSVVSNEQTITPAVVVCSATVSPVTTASGSTVLSTPVLAVAGVFAITPDVGSTLVSPPIQTFVGQPSPAEAAGSTITTSPISPLLVTVLLPWISAGVDIAAVTVDSVVAVVRPAFDVAISAVTVVPLVTVPAPTPSAGVLFASATVASLVTVPTVITTGGSDVLAAPVASLGIVPLPTSSASSDVTALPVNGTAGQPSPTEAASSTISAETVSPPLVTIPAVTPTAGSSPEAVVVAAVAQVIRPSFDVSISAITVTSALTVPTPTTSAGSLVTAAPVDASPIAIPAPALTASSEVLAVTVQTVVSVPTQDPAAHVDIPAPSVNALVGQPSPDEAAGSTISAETVSPPMVIVPAPSFSGGATPPVSTVVGSALVGSPLASAGQTVTAELIALLVAVLPPTIEAALGVSPTTVIAVTDVLVAAPSSGVTIETVPVTATTDVLVSGVSAGVEFTPVTVTAVANQPSPEEAATSTITASTVVALAAQSGPTVNTEQIISVATVATLSSFPPPEVSAGVTISGQTVAAVTYAPTLSVETSTEILGVLVVAVASILPLAAGPGTVLTTFELWESGSFIATLGVQGIDGNDGNTLIEFDLQPYLYLLADQTGAGIELRISAPSELEVESAEWDSMLDATLVENASVTPQVIPTVVSIPTSTVASGTSVSPDSVAALAQVGSAVVVAGGNLTAEQVSAVAAVPMPTVSCSLFYTAVRVDALAGVPNPSVLQEQALDAAVVAAVAFMPASGQSANSEADQDPIGIPVAIPGGLVSCGCLATPETISVTTTVLDPSIQSGSSVALAPLPVAAITSIYGLVESGITAAPTSVATATSVSTVTPSAGIRITATEIAASVRMVQNEVGGSSGSTPTVIYLVGGVNGGTGSAGSNALCLAVPTHAEILSWDVSTSNLLTAALVSTTADVGRSRMLLWAQTGLSTDSSLWANAISETGYRPGWGIRVF